MPAVARHVWDVFWKLERRGRAGNGFAAMPVSNSELQAWLVLHDDRLKRWELDILDILEAERVTFLNRDLGKTKKDKIASTPLTMEKFDAMFTDRINASTRH